MSMRLLLVFAGLVLLTPLVPAAAPPCTSPDQAGEGLAQPRRPLSPVTTDRLNEENMIRRLNSPVTVSFAGCPLSEVLVHLRNLSGLNIHVDRPALQAEGISLDSPISLKLEGVSLKSALDLILHDVHLTYVIKSEALEITTEAYGRHKPVVCTYEVGDIIARFSLNPPAGNATKQLIELITSTVAPSKWQENGGDGTIAFDPKTGKLVVKQPAGIHEEIVDLLAAIRRLQNQ